VRGELEKRNQDEAERQRVAESKRRALIESIARQQQSELQATAPRADLSVRSVPASNGELQVTAAPHKKSRWWVWTIVGVVAAGAVASAVTVGVIYGQPSGPQPGSFGLLDGRR
jgi:hypothetical protein